MIRQKHLKSYSLPGAGVKPRRFINPSDLLDFIVANDLPQNLADRVAKLAKE